MKKTKEKSILTVEDMAALLDVYDALEDLDKALGLIIGYEIGIGSESGLMNTFGKISNLICYNSPVFPEDENARLWFYELMDNRKIDNTKKARIFLGRE